MDLLLRRHVRRSDAAPAGEKRVDGGAAQERHLDADEMNAFAEGALPEAARARYAAHLADCDRCRKAVTRLALGAYASATGRSASPDVSSSRSWWREWVAALLAPPVLRFAVPALALLAVIGVVLVATRNRERSALVAQNEQTRVTSNTASSKTATPESQPSEEAPEESMAHEASPSTGSREPAEPKAHDRKQSAETTATQSSEKEPQSKANSNTTSTQATVPVPAGANSNAGAPLPKQPAGRERDEEAARMEKSRPMAAAAPPPPTPAPAENRRAENSTTVTEQNAPAVASRRSTESAAAADTSVSAAAAKPRPSYSARKSAARSRSAGPRKDDEAAAGGAGNANPVTRSVAGHRFRREGNAWIDVAYNPSQATVNVKRDSEQYRALIADEPGIGGIAEQLGGEVILVWKGRAYRIR